MYRDIFSGVEGKMCCNVDGRRQNGLRTIGQLVAREWGGYMGEGRNLLWREGLEVRRVF